MIRKHQTPCCSLCQLTVSNEDSKEDIQSALIHLQRDAKRLWDPSDRAGGERACYVITTPNEGPLASKLEELGFKNVTSFKRRNGYPQTGELKMWLKNW